MSTIKTFAGQTAIYGISTVAARALNFFFTPIYVGVYSPSTYAIFTGLYSWASLWSAVLALGMETTFFYYLNHYHHNDFKGKVYSHAFMVLAIVALIFLVGSFLWVDDIATWLYKGNAHDQINYRKYMQYLVGILTVDTLCIIPLAKIRADGQALRYGVIKFISILSFIGGNLFFIYIFPVLLQHSWSTTSYLAPYYHPGYLGYVFIANLTASTLTLILLLPQIMQVKFCFDYHLFRNMCSYAWPIWLASIFFIINEHADKLLLGKICPPEKYADLGIYGACSKLAVFLSIFIQAFRLGAEPFFFSHAKHAKSREIYARIMHYFVIFSTLLLIGLVANMDLLKYFIGSSATTRHVYWSGLGVVPILLFGYLSLGIYMNLSIWYKLSGQTKYGLYFSAIGALLTIILNAIFIPKYSYLAAAWVSLIAYTSMSILSYWIGQRMYPIPYKLKQSLWYLITAVLMVYLSFVVFHRSLLIGNILWLLFMGTICYTEHREIKALCYKV